MGFDVRESCRNFELYKSPRWTGPGKSTETPVLGLKDSQNELKSEEFLKILTIITYLQTLNSDSEIMRHY